MSDLTIKHAVIQGCDYPIWLLINHQYFGSHLYELLSNSTMYLPNFIGEKFIYILFWDYEISRNRMQTNQFQSTLHQHSIAEAWQWD